MKTNTANVEVERSGITESTGFSIKASAKAFKILSDGLYSDKILAIIRELSSNAFDAHTEAGTQDTPFLVHLPNSLEPWFMIRDYGTGLSHDAVMKNYTTYFDSTKTESNDFTGALGLGSKSPFSYVESWTVVSYFNGEKRIYVADLGEDGVPQFGMISVEETDEPNGLEIQLAVKSNDFRDFEYKAMDVYKRYNPLPEVVGVADFQLDPVTYSLEGTGWRVVQNQDRYGSRKACAVQGTVAYPINTGAMRTMAHENDLDYDDAISLLNNLNVELDFEIGELEIAANRETLGYDERTCNNIIAAAKKAVAEIEDQISKDFEDCKTLWEARLLYTHMFDDSHYGGGLYSLIRNNKVRIMWRDEEIRHNKVSIGTNENLMIQAFEYTSRRKRSTRELIQEIKTRKYSHNTSGSTLNIVASEKVVFFINDLEKGSAASRIKLYIENIEDAVQYIDEEKRKAISVVLFNPLTDEAYDEVVEKLGHPEIRQVSELDIRQRKVRGPASDGSDKNNAYVWKQPSSNMYWRDKEEMAKSHYWTSQVVDFNGGGFYVPTYRFNVVREVGESQHEYAGFDELLEWAEELDILTIADTTIYGIPKSHVGKLKGNWVNMFDYLVDAAQTMASDADTLKSLANEQTMRKFNDQIRNESTVVRNINNIAERVANRDNKFIPLNETIKELADVKELKHTLKRITAALGIEFVAPGEAIDLYAAFEELLGMYPMLKWIMNNYDSMNSQQLADAVQYIDMVDEFAEMDSIIDLEETLDKIEAA